MKHILLIGILAIELIFSGSIAGMAAPKDLVSRYNVVWNTPSKDASGVMPIGNGDVAAGVYAIENDDLYLLLSKNDAFSYLGDLFKTGRVRVTLSPNPFKTGLPFKQTLDLNTGSVSIEANGVKLRIWADANNPMYHIEIQSPSEIAVTVQPDPWKRIDHTALNDISGYSPQNKPAPNTIPTQDIILSRNGNLLWYYAVGDKSVYSDDLKHYNVEHMASQFADPFRFNTFGNLLHCAQLSPVNNKLTGKGKKFDIQIEALTLKVPDSEKWIEAIELQAQRKSRLGKDWKAHCKWWFKFWDRGWIIASDNTLPEELREKLSGETGHDASRNEKDGAAIVAQNYNVFRYLMACQSRGQIPAKFNGGLFTQQLVLNKPDTESHPHLTQLSDSTWLTHEDDRLWGRRFTFQNQRLLHWPLLKAGDFDLMKPFFNYYYNLLEMRKAITKAWFGHEGAYFRENTEPTGAERDCEKGGLPPKTNPGEAYEGWYHDYYFTSGLELVTMMIEYANFTNDTDFRNNTLVPFAREVLLFFDKHYLRDANGKLRIDPAQVLETFWIAVNPAPDVAGLQFVLDELLRMNAGTPNDKLVWKKFRSEIPEVPLRIIDGKMAIAPAEKFEKLNNMENGELYPVFPFRCFGLGLGTADVVDWTLQNRTNKKMFGNGCWNQNEIHWAFAGNAYEAAHGLVERFRTASPMCRFPMFGKEGPDSCPDLDHLGSGSVAFQRMIVQETPEKIVVLPAWPKNWDTSFRLNLTNNTQLEGEVKNGKIIRLKLFPETNTKTLVLGAGWSFEN